MAWPDCETVSAADPPVKPAQRPPLLGMPTLAPAPISIREGAALGILTHRKLLRVAAGIGIAGAVACCAGISASRAGTNPTVTVTTTQVGPLSTQLSTNSVWSGEIDQYPGAVRRFRALAAPLVRIHVGDDGWPVAMPEVRQDHWSFTALNVLVNDVFAAGQQPLMNIKFTPDWMWTCTRFGAAGHVRDMTFQAYAQYMARLVSYYNLGSMTTETGTVITNPYGTSHAITWWEPWNEPDLSDETPCSSTQNGGAALTPSQYVTMWNAVTSAMLAVDPTLKFVGPATAGGQFGSGTGPNSDYFTPLESAAVAPSALSFHGYGYWSNAVRDRALFNGDGSGYPDGGIDDMQHTARLLQSAWPGTPIWIDEMNVNADWGNDSHKRPWGPLAAAWWGTAFAKLAPLHVEMLDTYDIEDSPQFGLLSDQTGKPRIAYWVVKTLDAAFPPGSTQLSATSSSAHIIALAAQRPDGKITVMVVNRASASPTSSSGVGAPATVTVSLAALAPTDVRLTRIDSSTPISSGPVVVDRGAVSKVTLRFPGYGLDVLTITQ